MFTLSDLHIPTSLPAKSKNWNLGVILQELEKRQNPSFKLPPHTGYPILETRFVVISHQNSCSQQPPLSQHVWDHHLSYVCYTLPGKGQEYVINHLHLWVLSLPQIHALFLIMCTIVSWKKKILPPTSPFGAKHSSVPPQAMRSALSATHFMSSINVTPHEPLILTTTSTSA